MKKFDIPFSLQPEGSLDCGPTCTKMILAYYGITKSLEELQTQMTYNEVGTTIYDNASVLIHEGLHTTAITAQPLLFPPDITAELKKKEDIINLLARKEREENADAWILTSMKRYLENGGDLEVEIPALQHIKIAIDHNKPILALMHAGSLGSNEGTYHFVVVSGYNDTEVFINNPWPPSRKQGWFSTEQFLYGLHTSTTTSFDNGTLLIASK